MTQCSSTILSHHCYLKAGHDSDHEDDAIWWGDPTPGPDFNEPGNPFSGLRKRADNEYSVNLESE